MTRPRCVVCGETATPDEYPATLCGSCRRSYEEVEYRVRQQMRANNVDRHEERIIAWAARRARAAERKRWKESQTNRLAESINRIARRVARTAALGKGGA